MHAHAATEIPELPVASLRLREFGTVAADLDIDLAVPPSPELVTSVLACLLQDSRNQAPDREAMWQLAVSTRHAVLLAGAHRIDPRPFTFIVRCGNAECRQPVELELELDEILEFWKPDAADPMTIALDGNPYLLRRPTGDDQRAWQQLPPQEIAQARFSIIASLLVGAPASTLTAGLVDALDDALSDLDPLVNFSMQAMCPYCEVTGAHDIALAACAMQVLAAAQAALIDTVHMLAVGYGWTEEEALAIPPWRRRRYLTLLEQRGGR